MEKSKEENSTVADASVHPVVMQADQIKAAAQLTRALNRCHMAGLLGGVFSGRFCVWDWEANPHKDVDFFENVLIVQTRMNLDGGAGN